MKTEIELNGLSDAELSEAFAVEVAGLTNIQHWEFKDMKVTCKRPGDDMIYTLPSFTTSADAVMPWLEKTNQWSAISVTSRPPHGYAVTACIKPPTTFLGEAPTFARAACIALILAKRHSSKSPPHDPQHNRPHPACC